MEAVAEGVRPMVLPLVGATRGQRSHTHGTAGSASTPGAQDGALGGLCLLTSTSGSP